jgi:DNA-binding transcriptional ArsR family regulator
MSARKKSDETGGSLSELFEILSHESRRRILMAVAQHNPQDEDDITSETVADKHEEYDDALELLKQQLYHTHLPKLADGGFIDWDRDSGTITRGPRFEEIEPLLRLMHDHQDELPDNWP